METTHQFTIGNAGKCGHIASNSVDLVVTSPPYPMIQMWDSVFSAQDETIQTLLDRQQGGAAFEAMHRLLEPVWDETYRVLKDGGFACINIGDAVRTMDSQFMLYPNHARILDRMMKTGFTPLPAIIWRKQTNAPNKFMGSGMLPAGAYVTLEHEYILIFRKGAKRAFPRPEEKTERQESAIFWEERNQWFSDVWMDLKGTVQKLDQADARSRSAAFPFELPYRLICMYSTADDMVFDPFLGLGTTMLGAMAAGRNSIGMEVAPDLEDPITDRIKNIIDLANARIARRLENHIAFLDQRIASGKPIRHTNAPYGFPVITAQEKNLMLHDLVSVTRTGPRSFTVTYSDQPQEEFCRPWPDRQDGVETSMRRPVKKKPKPSKHATQLELF